MSNTIKHNPSRQELEEVINLLEILGEIADDVELVPVEVSEEEIHQGYQRLLAKLGMSLVPSSEEELYVDVMLDRLCNPDDEVSQEEIKSLNTLLMEKFTNLGPIDLG